MLRQVKALNNIITELSHVNLLVLNGKPLPSDYQAQGQELFDATLLARGVSGHGVSRNNPDSPEKNLTTLDNKTALESNGTASQTTRLVQT